MARKPKSRRPFRSYPGTSQVRELIPPSTARKLAALFPEKPRGGKS